MGNLRSVLTAGCVSVVMAVAAGASHAATFNFVTAANAARSANGGVEQNWSQAFPTGWTVDGVTLFASATNSATGSANVDAFLDSTDGSGPAGLGVCSSLALAGGCSTGASGPTNTADDNVGPALGGVETLVLSFDQSVSFIDLLFRDASHKLVNGTLLIDGVERVIAAGTLSGGFAALTGITSAAFTYGGSRASEFYLSGATVAPVPLPASVLFLVSGLGGMGWLGRRRRTATT